MKRFTVLLTFLVFVFSGLLAQDVQITGNVTSSVDGTPLPGVSVVVKGTTVGTVTNLDGDYKINVPQDAETLVFSFVKCLLWTGLSLTSLWNPTLKVWTK